MKNECVCFKWGWSSQPWDFSQQRHTIKGGSATKHCTGEGALHLSLPALIKDYVIDLSALDATRHSGIPYTSSDCSQNDLLIII